MKAVVKLPLIRLAINDMAGLPRTAAKEVTQRKELDEPGLMEWCRGELDGEDFVLELVELDLDVQVSANAKTNLEVGLFGIGLMDYRAAGRDVIDLDGETPVEEGTSAECGSLQSAGGSMIIESRDLGMNFSGVTGACSASFPLRLH